MDKVNQSILSYIDELVTQELLEYPDDYPYKKSDGQIFYEDNTEDLATCKVIERNINDIADVIANRYYRSFNDYDNLVKSIKGRIQQIYKYVL